MTHENGSPPHWVADNPIIQKILNTYINKIESNQQLKMFVNAKQPPELYDFDAFDTEQLWRLVVSKLQNEHGIIEVRTHTKLSVHDLPYEKARLTFNVEKEAKVREWLNRPFRQNYRRAWQAAVADVGTAIPNPNAFSTPIHISGRSAIETVAAFVRLADTLSQLEENKSSLSLRTLSARCFWGDSKFLDHRRALLENAFPATHGSIQPRAIMMSAYIPDDIGTALFIENFDSFCNTIAAVKKTEYSKQIAVIYSAGFRSSAERIRQAGNARFVVINQVSPEAYEQFLEWWFDEQNNKVSCYFWGDLDFSGMAILKAMRAKFKSIEPWQYAYEHTISYHKSGARHAAGNARKEQQTDPGFTGCEYADQELLPLMRKSRAFTDQEVVGEEEIVNAINELF